MKRTGPSAPAPLRRPCLALLVICLAAAGPPARADSATEAMEIAMMIGEVESLGDICAAPAPSYEPTLARATAALGGYYRAAGLDPGDVAADIAQGRQDETARHDDLAWPLNCNRFQGQVAAIDTHIVRLRNQSAALTHNH